MKCATARVAVIKTVQCHESAGFHFTPAAMNLAIVALKVLVPKSVSAIRRLFYGALNSDLGFHCCS